MRVKKTKKEYLQEIVEKYRAASQRWPVEIKVVAAWAIANGLWEPHPQSALSLCARELAEALRQEHFTDPQGRRVRKMHAVRRIEFLPDGERQLVFWIDIEDAAPDQMHAAFQQRRMQIFDDCRQLRTDVDSFNDNNRFGKRIQLCFDFTEDLAESEQPEVYPGVGVLQ